MADDPHVMDINKATTLPNGDLYMGSTKGYERPDTIEALPPEPGRTGMMEEAERFAASGRRALSNADLVAGVVAKASEGA